MDEVWRGAAPARYCDSAGTLSLQSHLAIAMEGLAGLAHELGLGAAFAAAALARLRPYDIRIALTGAGEAGAPVHALGAVIAADEAALTARIDLCGRDDAPLAEIEICAEHVAARTGAAFGWPRRVQERLAAMDLAGAPAARPERGAAHSLARAEKDGLTCAARGAFGAQETDTAGAVAPEAILDRMAGAFAGAAHPRRCRLVLRRPAGPGQPYRVMAGRTSAGGVVWLIDAGSGRALAGAQFDAAPKSWPERGDLAP